MNLITTKLLVAFFSLTVAQSLSAQSLTSLPANNADEERMINIYRSSAREHDPIYNGREYERYPFYITSGIPYYNADTLVAGEVQYDGLKYNGVPLMYDLISDELITKDFTGNHLIKLVKQKVDSFNIHATKFIFIRSGEKVPEGYYKLIYSGRSQVLSKEVRKIVDEVRGEQLYKNIESRTTYYVKHNDKYYPVTNISSLAGIFSDKDKINKILNDNKKKYKKEDLRIVLLHAVTSYDQLTP